MCLCQKALLDFKHSFKLILLVFFSFRYVKNPIGLSRLFWEHDRSQCDGAITYLGINPERIVMEFLTGALRPLGIFGPLLQSNRRL